MITNTDFSSGRITGARLHIEGMGSAYAWQLKRPFGPVGAVAVGVSTTDNSTGVSARKRRRL
jgi:hypothetical protein